MPDAQCNEDQQLIVMLCENKDQPILSKVTICEHKEISTRKKVTIDSEITFLQEKTMTFKTTHFKDYKKFLSTIAFAYSHSSHCQECLEEGPDHDC